ncbi:Arc family DNA-binding protein [Paralysiella testudinis]|uniref:Arc family DNA-binding protein n=1 Tax=Paralysiella testudinis TaxID=2809020 RepID=A0A892ZG10_9NEIS|nr:Arc family DNA-binding protein [Paralysiella testudinis]QRQ80676.1 Arc family DNA-binding protein [Paralysiella testudinis]
MNRNIAPFGLRLPEELKAWLKQQAAQNHRSLNSEILARLEASRKAVL